MTDKPFDAEAVVDAIGAAAEHPADAGIARRDHSSPQDRGRAGRSSSVGRDRRRGRARPGVPAVTPLLDGSAHAIATAVRDGAASAVEVTRAALGRIEARDDAYGAFTDVVAERAS